jgi:hypothetical protein
MKFCESCGAKIEPLVTETMSDPDSARQAEETPKKSETGEGAVTGSAAAKTIVKQPEKVSRENMPKRPLPQQTIIIAGVVILALLAAAVYFVVLPMISGSSPASPAGGVPLLPGVSGTTAASSVTQVTNGQAVAPTLTAGPTDITPSRFSIILDAERDPISHNVTVTFRGGEGQYGVSNILVRLTRSDGQVLTQNFKPVVVGSGVTFPGTEKTDRVEATTTFYSGEHFKIMDKIFEYQKRNG